MPPRSWQVPPGPGVHPMTGLWFRLFMLGLRPRDRPKAARLGTDRSHFDDATVRGLNAVAVRRDPCSRREQLSDLPGFLRTDAQDVAIGEKRAAQLTFRTEPREPHRSCSLHF